MVQLTQEMIDWLNSRKSGTWLPALKTNFCYEFGYKKTGVPDSMKIEEASALVDIWYEKFRIKKQHKK